MTIQSINPQADAPKDLKAILEEVLQYQKVDPEIGIQYRALIEEYPNLDLEKAKLSFTALVRDDSVQLEGKIGHIGNVYSILISYAHLPALIQDKGVIRLEASRAISGGFDN
jgi:hypothetical protein